MQPVLVPGVPAPAIVDSPKPVLIHPAEVSAAHNYSLIAFVLVFIMFIPYFIIVLAIGAFGLLASPYLPFMYTLPPAIPAWLAAVPFLGPILILLTFPGVGLPPDWLVYTSVGVLGLLVGLTFLILVWFGTVRAINKGRYAKAHGTTLLLAILFIIPVFAILASPTVFYPTVFLLLPAFFWLLSYGSLGEVIAKYGPVAVLGEAVPGIGIAGPPPPPRPGRANGRSHPAGRPSPSPAGRPRRRGPPPTPPAPRPDRPVPPVRRLHVPAPDRRCHPCSTSGNRANRPECFGGRKAAKSKVRSIRLTLSRHDRHGLRSFPSA